jgi:hypothetical protein
MTVMEEPITISGKTKPKNGRRKSTLPATSAAVASPQPQPKPPANREAVIGLFIDAVTKLVDGKVAAMRQTQLGGSRKATTLENIKVAKQDMRVVLLELLS